MGWRPGDSPVWACGPFTSNYRHAGDVFREAVRRAGLKGQGRLSLHSLRHGYVSLLIAGRLDVVFVSCQRGHANASVTLSVYAHLFAQREHGLVARLALEASYEAMAAGQGNCSCARAKENGGGVVPPPLRA